MNDPTPLFRPTWIPSRAFCRKWQSLPRILFAVTLLFLLAPRAKADPTLSAAPNPVSVPAGQMSAATTLTRNDEGPEGFLWMAVDGGEETLVAPDALIAGAAQQVSVEAGKSYEFRLYNAEKDQMIASVTATATLQAAPVVVPPVAPGGGGLFKNRIKIGDAIKRGPTFASIFITNVKVTPRAGIVDISYATRQPADALIEIATQKPLAAIDGLTVPSPIPAGQKVPPAFAPGILLNSFAARNDKLTQRSLRLKQLAPNTTYHYVISTRAPDGQLHRDWGSFKTLNRVVKVKFERVLVTEDGLNGNAGAFSFKFAVNDEWLRIPTGNLVSFPRDNTFTPIGEKEWRDIPTETVLDGAPDMVPLMVYGLVVGRGPLGLGGGGSGLFAQNSATNQDPRPKGQDSGAAGFQVWNTARDEVDASANDNDLPGTYPFTIRTPAGQGPVFEIAGRLEVSYSEPPQPAPANPLGKINIGNLIRQGGIKADKKTQATPATPSGKPSLSDRFKILPR